MSLLNFSASAFTQRNSADQRNRTTPRITLHNALASMAGEMGGFCADQAARRGRRAAAAAI